MSESLLSLIEEKAKPAIDEVSIYRVKNSLLFGDAILGIETQKIKHSIEMLEIAIIAQLCESKGIASWEKYKTSSEKATIINNAATIYELWKSLYENDASLINSVDMLRMSLFAVIADKRSDVARFLSKYEFSTYSEYQANWGDYTLKTICNIWLYLIRKKGWDDIDNATNSISSLRELQDKFEETYLKSSDPRITKHRAIELICLYHLAKTAEVLATYITNGVVDKNYQIHELMQKHFDDIFEICSQSSLITLEPLARFMYFAAMQMIDNSIWNVTRAVNSRVTKFVKTLVDRGRGSGTIFEVLPPQRLALAEKKLLGSSPRSVVVSLPTSSGKTLIAQFRILQALNQFDADNGWVAYIAPTKSLVNQIARRLRNDFSLLGIGVEQVSPALEVDNIERSLLAQSGINMFKVLVTTPEKLDLIIRQGWEEKIGRPLTLVVVDEAHNLQDSNRGLRLELLLATINKECEYAQFLLLTPFIPNGEEVSRWLGGTNSENINLSFEWQPNDRIIGIVSPEKQDALRNRSFDYSLNFETVQTSRKTLAIDETISFPKIPEIAKTFSEASKIINLSAMSAQVLSKRGSVILMHNSPAHVWSLANKLRLESNIIEPDADINVVKEYIKLELGNDFPLSELLDYGIGVHHAGLPDDIKILMEWLFESEKLRYLVATTTIAQGVNFPVSSVVMATNTYPSSTHTVEMPAEDFWNIAGRAGRVNQGQTGIIALIAGNEIKKERLKEYINTQTKDLNSSLIKLINDAGDLIYDLEAIVYKRPEWSSLLQYLVHSYRQMGESDTFVEELEQVLRGTLGYRTLRQDDSQVASRFLNSVKEYAAYIQSPGKPLKLVDSTGFSLQSIMTVLAHKGDIGSSSWDKETLFSSYSTALKDMMGVLLRVPELRSNLEDVVGGKGTDGDKLSLVIKDWVNGENLSTIAKRYFAENNEDLTESLTKCGRNIFGKLTQTASWGLGALLSITANNLSEEEFNELSNLPSRVFYGVNSDEAIIMRLLGVPRSASQILADSFGNQMKGSIHEIREKLQGLSTTDWDNIFKDKGSIYKRVWDVIEGRA